MTETSLQHDQPATIPVRSFGKRVRSMAGYTIVTALMFVPPLVVFLPASLLHCGLRNGRRAAWLLLVLSADCVGLLLFSSPGRAAGVETLATLAPLPRIFFARPRTG